ncbi:MAG: hypothetical protein U1F14_11695, partial [Steroidobacteraceae bacterium]
MSDNTSTLRTDGPRPAPPLWRVLALGVLGAIAVVGLGAVRLKKPLWNLDARTTMVFAIIGGLYLATAVALALRDRRTRVSLPGILLAVGAATAVLFGVVLLLCPDFPRTPLIAAPMIMALLAWLTVSVRHRWAGAGMIVALALVG